MNENPGLVDTIFGYERYLPHGYCFLWQPDLVWLHVVSDLVIALSYYSIPVTISYILYRRGQAIPYRWIFIMSAVFIALCGTTHLIEIVTLWYPMYYLQGFVKALTAAASLATALLILPVMPTLLAQLGDMERRGVDLLDNSSDKKDSRR